MKTFRLWVVTFILLWSSIWATGACARDYRIDSERSYVKGSIRYSLIGAYEAQFMRVEGDIAFDPENLSQSHVDISMDVKSLESAFPVLDRIVKSRQFLNAAKYPKIRFQSRRVTRYKDRYFVEGRVHLNGVWRELAFPFQIEPLADGKAVSAGGVFVLNRKDFDIIWNDWLDHGGLIVGNHITVDWRVIGHRI